MKRTRLTMRVLEGIQTACSQLEADDPETIPLLPGQTAEEEYEKVAEALLWVNEEISRRKARSKRVK